MKVPFAALALSASLFVPVAARADDIQLAAQGLQACAQVFPDGKKAAKAFKSLGFKLQNDVQGVSTYANGGVNVATSSAKGVPLRCMSTASGLSVAQAKALAQSVLPMLQGAQDAGLNVGGVEAFWLGKMNGKSAGLVVAGPQGDWNGASVTIILN